MDGPDPWWSSLGSSPHVATSQRLHGHINVAAPVQAGAEASGCRNKTVPLEADHRRPLTTRVPGKPYRPNRSAAASYGFTPGPRGSRRSRRSQAWTVPPCQLNCLREGLRGSLEKFELSGLITALFASMTPQFPHRNATA
jgi:hypothetical protein